MNKLLLVTALVAFGAASAVQATPVTSNVFSAGQISFNPSGAGAAATVSGNGITLSGGQNYGGAAYGLDMSYLDVPGAIHITFSTAMSGFGFDFTANNVDVILSAYDITNTLLETYIFPTAGLPAPQGFPTGYAGFNGLSGVTSAVVSTALTGVTGSIFIGTVNADADVPEPAMLGLFGMGALALGLARRRRG